MKDLETLNNLSQKMNPEEAKEPTDQKNAPDTKPSESGPKAIPETLTQQQALEALIQGVVLGQKSGIYTLEDAELLSKAIRAFVKPGTQV